MAAVAGLPVDTVGIVHERGNLEFNGVDSVMLNWSVIGDPRRNRGYTRERAEADLERYFGVSGPYRLMKILAARDGWIRVTVHVGLRPAGAAAAPLPGWPGRRPAPRSEGLRTPDLVVRGNG